MKYLRKHIYQGFKIKYLKAQCYFFHIFACNELYNEVCMVCSNSHHNRAKCSNIIHSLVYHLILYRVKCSNIMYSLVYHLILYSYNQ